MNPVGYEYGEKVRWVVESAYGGYMGNKACADSFDMVEDMEDAMMFTSVKSADMFISKMQPFTHRLCRVALTIEVTTYEVGD